jgi:glycosyltransferase involved in cell wall biosynthesis
MNIVILTHPHFLGSQSMPRYARMLADGMIRRKHEVQVWSPPALLCQLPFPAGLKKWAGYIDQYVMFSLKLRNQLKYCSSDTLFVLADQALGPWMPIIVDRPHVVHCHDFLAQRSAKGEFPENRVKITGRIYQALIRRGYRRAKHFIAISKNTQQDLFYFLKSKPLISRVVYNGLNQSFSPGDKRKNRIELEEEIDLDLSEGFILHVGGNQFYKNRKGVIKIYEAWRELSKRKIPLLMIGAVPTGELKDLSNKSPFSGDIHFLCNISDDVLMLAYKAASLLLYPSLEEGFGWPIAEAMASGCLVVTTNKAPMNEVGGDSCFYIRRHYESKESLEDWAIDGAREVEKVLHLPESDRHHWLALGFNNAKRFNTEDALDQIEQVYQRILETNNC